MSKNPIGHIDLRVPDLEAGVAFYSTLLPEVGYTEYLGGQQFRCWAPAGSEGPAGAWFGITADRGHVANANRIAFWAESRAEVDRVAALLPAAGALAISGPKAMTAYSDSYYAVFFTDPWGNALEILHYNSSD